MQQWKKQIGAWYLNRKLNRSDSKLSHPTILKQVPRNALILFDASLTVLPGISTKIAAMLQEQGFKAERLGFYSDSSEHEDANFSHFNEKSLSWLGEPKGDLITNIHRQAWDIIISLHDETDLSLQWLASSVYSNLKIGTALRFGIYDIVLEGHSPAFSSFPDHLQNVLLTLKKQTHAFA